ncbi:hypothetical protein K5Q02_01970 [Pseudomonas sp. MM211]|uniref:hypothetical protein n=1 Tax=Pseudomonas sp. MM211 TaxID=2866808 RepID=UPI001CEC7927|nr:hypothetical protein [Pseudomonas sp. MM211]UCJ17185.1 hypothetical protein K5Q02_01970 [Pseudomonas sp. MM211]
MKIDSRAPLAHVDSASQVSNRADLLPTSIKPSPAPREPSLPRTPPLPSVQDDLQALELAAGVEPGLFAGSRPAEILEDILERILPTLPLDGETRTLAMALVREELDTRQALDRQRVETETGE